MPPARIPDPTPIPFPTFQKAPGENGSPAYFYEFLSNLSTKLDEKDPEEMSRKQEWRHLMRALADNFLNTFPSPQDLPWDAIHESLKLTEVSLTLLGQIASLPGAGFLFSTDNLGKDLFVRLMKNYTILDAWVDMSVPSDRDYPSPEELQSKTLNALVILIRSLASSAILDAQNSTLMSWGLQRVMLNACLGLCEGIVDRLCCLAQFNCCPRYSLDGTPRHLTSIRDPSSDSSRT